MKIGVVIYSNDSETVWHAFRYGNFCIAMGDEVTVFLLGKGVEVESVDRDVFNVNEHIQTFINSGGKMFACGTCLEIHGLKASEIYQVATMEDIYRIVKESERVLTF